MDVNGIRYHLMIASIENLWFNTKKVWNRYDETYGKTASDVWKMSIVLRPAPEVQADEISQNVVISACGLAFCHGIAGITGREPNGGDVKTGATRPGKH